MASSWTILYQKAKQPLPGLVDDEVFGERIAHALQLQHHVAFAVGSQGPVILGGVGFDVLFGPVQIICQAVVLCAGDAALG